MDTIELAITQWNKKNRTSHQAKLPTSATNLSKSFAPAQLIPAQNITVINLKMFFSHFTRGSSLPLCEKIPFSMIRTAGKSCNGTERRMANEYRNCTYNVWWDKCKGLRLSDITHCLDELAFRIEVSDDDSLNFRSKSQVCKDTSTTKKHFVIEFNRLPIQKMCAYLWGTTWHQSTPLGTCAVHASHLWLVWPDQW